MTPGGPADTLRLLLVEDSAGDVRLLLESLHQEIAEGTVSVTVARRLDDARRELSSDHYSCVLLDLGLPDGEGAVNVQRILETDACAKVVVLSGLESPEAERQARRCGASAYLIKGENSGARLLDAVRAAMGDCSAGRARRSDGLHPFVMESKA
jgi:DNA-binding response OmpR family regulator